MGSCGWVRIQQADLRKSVPPRYRLKRLFFFCLIVQRFAGTLTRGKGIVTGHPTLNTQKDPQKLGSKVTVAQVDCSITINPSPIISAIAWQANIPGKAQI